MASVQPRPPIQPGEPAPDFTLPAADHEGYVSLADYRGRSPVLLAIMRGLYCAFCRRHIQHLGGAREKLREVGVETLAIVASNPDRARLYYRLRPARVPLAADPDLTTHRAYGLPSRPMTAEVRAEVESKYRNLAHELGVPAPEIHGFLDRRDAFEPLSSDHEDLKRQGAQSIGQFIVDRGGIVRWANLEGVGEGAIGRDRFPTEGELLAAARAL